MVHNGGGARAGLVRGQALRLVVSRCRVRPHSGLAAQQAHGSNGSRGPRSVPQRPARHVGDRPEVHSDGTIVLIGGEHADRFTGQQAFDGLVEVLDVSTPIYVPSFQPLVAFNART